jgi:hypothetical protein
MDIKPSGPININNNKHSIIYKPEEKELSIISNKHTSGNKTEIFVCDTLYTNKEKNTLIVFGPT